MLHRVIQGGCDQLWQAAARSLATRGLRLTTDRCRTSRATSTTCTADVAGVQMGDVGDLVADEGAADAGLVRPAVHAGLEECAVEDQLTAPVEQVEQVRLTLGSVELVLLLHRKPWHPPTFGG